ncbi:DUF2809 domain-containing protein [Kitasatospora sp. NPDC048538]|uniref:ribosomal maturation YjgA family protein n=1 Tax=unclassified Kitasatospora TaxID=2633591 RepID=UPI0033D40AC7
MDGLRGDGWVRAAAGAAAGLTVAAGLGARALLGGEPAKAAGDALYTVLVYALVVLVAPRVRPWRAAVTASVVSWAVEFLQLTGVPEELGRRSTPARLVLGSTFNPPDLFWYLVGALSAALVHRALSALRGRRVHRGRRVLRTERPAAPDRV